jgi:transposase
MAAKHESMRVLWDIAAEYESLDARRDEAMRKAKADGASYEDIGMPFKKDKGTIRLWFIKWAEQGKT